jgi:two-component system, NarL family, captular synthesis response regulator RcsB
MTIRTIIADDHSIVRLCINKEVGKVADLLLVAEVSSPHQLVAELARTPCDLLILDLNMPYGPTEDGLPMLDCVLQHYPGLFVIVLTMVTHPDMLRAVGSRHVVGLISKCDFLGTVSTAVQKILSGERYVSAGIRAAISAPHSHWNGRSTRQSALSEIELRVIRLFVAGRSFGEIAALLGIDMLAASRHKMRVMEKLGLRGDLELYTYALQNGFAI